MMWFLGYIIIGYIINYIDIKYIGRKDTDDAIGDVLVILFWPGYLAIITLIGINDLIKSIKNL